MGSQRVRHIERLASRCTAQPNNNNSLSPHVSHPLAHPPADTAEVHGGHCPGNGVSEQQELSSPRFSCSKLHVRVLAHPGGSWNPMVVDICRGGGWHVAVKI